MVDQCAGELFRTLVLGSALKGPPPMSPGQVIMRFDSEAAQERTTGRFKQNPTGMQFKV
jgi:hypothetical protein